MQTALFCRLSALPVRLFVSASLRFTGRETELDKAAKIDIIAARVKVLPGRKPIQ
jgi:hypothetical protein